MKKLGMLWLAMVISGGVFAAAAKKDQKLVKWQSDASERIFWLLKPSVDQAKKSVDSFIKEYDRAVRLLPRVFGSLKKGLTREEKVFLSNDLKQVVASQINVYNLHREHPMKLGLPFIGIENAASAIYYSPAVSGLSLEKEEIREVQIRIWVTLGESLKLWNEKIAKEGLPEAPKEGYVEKIKCQSLQEVLRYLFGATKGLLKIIKIKKIKSDRDELLLNNYQLASLICSLSEQFKVQYKDNLYLLDERCGDEGILSNGQNSLCNKLKEDYDIAEIEKRISNK